MKTFIAIFSILYFNVGFGQNWTTIPGSNIQFSNFIHANNDNWYSYSTEYFKKGDTVISISKNYVKDLYILFQKEAFTFDSIFNQTRRKFISIGSDADTTFKKIKFKIAVHLSSLEVVDGHDELIWIITNYSLAPFSQPKPCFTNVAFRKEKSEVGIVLKFLSAKMQSCHL